MNRPVDVFAQKRFIEAVRTATLAFGWLRAALALVAGAGFAREFRAENAVPNLLPRFALQRQQFCQFDSALSTPILSAPVNTLPMGFNGAPVGIGKVFHD